VSKTNEPVADVNVSGNIKRLATIDALDEWNVPDSLKVIAVQGLIPDEPKDGDNSRSAWVFHLTCGLVRYEVPDDVIYSILTDQGFKISESVLEVSNFHKYAIKQIKSAKQKVTNDPDPAAKTLVLHPANPTRSAREFIKWETPDLIYILEDWLCYDGTSYETLEDATIKAKVREFLDRAKVPAKTEGAAPGPFLPTKSKKAEVLDAIRDLSHLPKDKYEPPCWLGNAQQPAREILACQNGLLHLPTGELLSATPDFFTRNALNFA